MKRILLLAILSVCVPYSVAQETPKLNFSTILDKDRGIADVLPFDMCYLSSFFSVRYQMARYGIAMPGQWEGTGYEYAQLSNPVYTQVSALLKELNFDIQSTYILRLHPAWKNGTTTVIATNACIFIDEEEWLTLDHPHYKEQFKALSKLHNWDVDDPIKEIKKYILKRALAHYNQGTYRKKVASKLLVGATLGFVAYKSISHLNEYMGAKDAELGISDSIAQAIPTISNICSKLFITTFAKWWASVTLSTIIGDQIRGAFQSTCALPYWRHLDSSAEYKAVSQEPNDVKQLLASYNASQAKWKAHNPLLKEEYLRRTAAICALISSVS